MDYFVICLITLLISILTLFSGFGLGTVLMPVFAIFFPLQIAIASTAVIHLANNIFKAVLVGKYANWKVVIKFGIPAALTTIIGAFLLGSISQWEPLAIYHINTHVFKITILGLSIGTIIIFSSLFELIPKLAKLTFPPKYIPLGGFLSGFFGGISGHQGIFRSAFLIKSGLTKEEFIGTSVLPSIIVDIIRLIVYGWNLQKTVIVASQEMFGILIVASLTAFLGSYIGARLIHQVTFSTVQLMVGILLLMIGIAIAFGIV